MQDIDWKAKYEAQLAITESLKRDLMQMQQKHPEQCSNPANSASEICTNRFQCWEPCGSLGNDERFVSVVKSIDANKVDAALGIVRKKAE